LLERSSLGTRGARSLRKRVSNAQVEKVWQRFDQSDVGRGIKQSTVTGEQAADAVSARPLNSAQSPQHPWPEPRSTVGALWSNDEMLPAGTVLDLDDAQWSVVAPLPGGSGGFGTVYVVTDRQGHEAVAKLVRKDVGAQRELLIGESIRAAQFRNVMPVLDQGEHGDSWVLVMPRAQTSLADWFAQHGPFSVDELVPVLTDIAIGLADIGGKLVHRDLKPGNVLLLDETWTLADFGIARYADASTAPDTRKHSMTPEYASPEQWLAEHATAQTDVYAFGVIGYELLSGNRPFPGPDPANFRDQHCHAEPPPLTVGSRRLRDLLAECLLKAPEARPRPAQLVQRLAKIAEEPAVPGFKQLAEANAQEVRDRAEQFREASVEQQRQATRQRLHEAATTLFAPVINDLLEALQDNAPTANIATTGPTTSDKMLMATLRGAQLAVDRPQPSLSMWTAPFTVISESKIAVTMQASVRGYRGRSHSLWYCDPFVEGEFAWYELAFMNQAFGGQPEIVPFALPAREARIAFEPVVGTTQIAWPFQEIDRSNPTEFLGRWLGWFAQAATGAFQQPMMLPERPINRTWRR
jgi:eukaryotic-like serine/threonine-protein kinase